MAELGISNFEEFDFISKPPKSGIAGAIDILNLLDALAEDRRLSKTGELMCAFPLLPRLSRMIVESMLRYPEVIHETLVAASFLSTMSPYILPPGEELEARKAHHAFRDPMGDFVSYLRIYDAFIAAADKTKFCEHNYLDERTMREILRIREQLEIIVSDMGFPISRGGPLADYLCAVSRGLIQFVCARQDRGLFRSLTAEKIQIHPGSVMFRENPDFIVAGEIVRTTRMYAMSVSPLSKEILNRISPLVAERLSAISGRAVGKTPLGTERRTKTRGTGGEERTVPGRQESRGFTDTIQLGGQIFDLTKGRGKKKMVVLPWERFKAAKNNLDQSSGSAFKGLLAVIQQGSYSLLEGDKLETIIRIRDWLDLDRDLQRDWPRSRNFEILGKEGQEGLNVQVFGDLVENLSHVFQVAKPKGKDKKLGFVSLYTDGQGVFWFRISKGFHTALNESIASLEALIDAADDVKLAEEAKESIGDLYRKLSSFFE